MVTLTSASKKRDLKCGSFVLRVYERTHLMGILNVTPDSFSDGGRFMDTETAISHALRMAAEGADIIDIGGESTRPGSDGVTAFEEIRRTVPIIQGLAGLLKVPISIDTSKSEVALAAIQAGASMVNDVTALKSDLRMADVIARTGVSVSLMHMKGTPKDMQNHPHYDDLMIEIAESLRGSIDIAVRAGISRDKIIVDPGIGFGKTAEHNLLILNRLAELRALDLPILIGTSRKSFIGSILNRGVSERLTGTTTTCAIAVMNGANILRVHDVGTAAEAARVADAIKKEKI
ncbi:MAG: dihydropteroate synthase [Candidatus Omnitrophica bacterium]|nr:dihydropteroate synthase [Candidatus Omnitrophota bacterium]